MTLVILRLHVEDPFVDLNPRQASHFGGLLALLAVKFAATLLVHTLQVFDLMAALANAVLLIATAAGFLPVTEALA